MSVRATVLLVDDEAAFRENVAEFLRSKGYETVEAGSAEEGLALARERYVDAALVDIQMPGMDGLGLLEALREVDPWLEVVIVTGRGSIESAVDAMRRGAYHYVTKPVRLGELELVLRRAIERAALARQNEVFREEIRRRRDRAGFEVVAASEAMRRVLESAERIAGTDSTILIEGETGTGKEVVAEFIHRRSRRAASTFSVLNCGALSESLVDAELFGNEKGAFTGATEARPGILEVSDGGTLLLDEIGDMALPAQVRLLRFLERGVLRRVGSARERSVDVRVLAATHRNLEREVAEGRFRQDLYYRLLQFRLALPPLRERPEDILALAERFLEGAEPRPPVSAGARRRLLEHPWPGNVRELAHTIARARFSATFAGHVEIEVEDLALPDSADPEGDLVTIEEAERRHIRRVLARVGGNRQRAAQVLGITERHLYRLLQKEGERRPAPERAGD